MTIDPAEQSPSDIYKLMVGVIVPRPIAFVSSLSADGVRNLAPFSFFTARQRQPAGGLLLPHDAGQRRHTGRTRCDNVEATREFVVNIVSEEFAAR